MEKLLTRTLSLKEFGGEEMAMEMASVIVRAQVETEAEVDFR